jgi:hypothetical protein
MSGGSYDYLCYKEAGDLIDHESTLQEMADRLAGLGYAADAAHETQHLLLTIRQFKNRIATMKWRLCGVWKAIEWWDSGDSGEERVKDELAKYRDKSHDTENAMHEKINAGGSAFPVWELNGHNDPEMTGFGIDLRDYFAAKAMNKVMLDPSVQSYRQAAREAYMMADAMLVMREVK